MTLYSWTDRYFETTSKDYWATAMNDATTCHVVGTMPTTYHIVGTKKYIIRQDKDFYFHKVRAYCSLRQKAARGCEMQLRLHNTHNLPPPHNSPPNHQHILPEPHAHPSQRKRRPPEPA
jgi:hypothetical protein